MGWEKIRLLFSISKVIFLVRKGKEHLLCKTTGKLKIQIFKGFKKGEEIISAGEGDTRSHAIRKGIKAINF